MPHVDSRSYTVRDIAAILAAQETPEGVKPSGELVGKRLRQVRHWTACDYLRPIGKKHSGTGVARRYGPDEVRKAALLRELTRFGLTITQFDEEFGDSLDYRASQREWRQAIEAKKQILFQVIFEAGGDASEATMMINLVPAEKSLLRMLDPQNMPSKSKKGKSVKPLPYMHFVSALTISLTQLFATLRL